MPPPVLPAPLHNAPQDNGPSGSDARRVLRSAALILAQHEIRSVRRWFEEFDRDILLAILLGEIALHNVGALQMALPGAGTMAMGTTRPIARMCSPRRSCAR